MSILIKNAQLANAEITNIFIKNDTFFEIGSTTRAADTTIDAKGKIALPGVIDSHVHFRTPGHEYKEDWQTGSKAAAAGGVTTVLDMPNNNPAITSRKGIEAKHKLIQNKTYINYGLYIGATVDNLEELKAAKNIAGIKVFLGSSTGTLLVKDYTVVEQILNDCEHMVAFHSEDEKCLSAHQKKYEVHQKHSSAQTHYEMRTERCAVVSAQRIMYFVEKTKHPVYICHVSSKGELKELSLAKERGLPVYIEVTPHHLFLNKDTASHLDNYAKVNPPLRCTESQEALLQAVVKNKIDTVATDHAPHTKEEKEKSYHEAPSGCPGIETSLPLMFNFYHQGKITLEHIQKTMCEHPAEIFKIPKRGFLKEGFYADLVLIDLNLTKRVKGSTLYTKVKWSLFEGVTLTGWPILTIVNGSVVYTEGRIIGQHYGKPVFL